MCTRAQQSDLPLHIREKMIIVFIITVEECAALLRWTETTILTRSWKSLLLSVFVTQRKLIYCKPDSWIETQLMCSGLCLFELINLSLCISVSAVALGLSLRRMEKGNIFSNRRLLFSVSLLLISFFSLNHLTGSFVRVQVEMRVAPGHLKPDEHNSCWGNWTWDLMLQDYTEKTVYMSSNRFMCFFFF